MQTVADSPRRISASILRPHPTEYPGRDVLRYGNHEWRLLFQELKDLGIDTVILEKTADLDLKEVYSRSSQFAGYTHFNLLEPLLHAAAHEELAVFLGGAASQAGFSSLEWLDHILEGYRELRAYRRDFHGFYIQAPEMNAGTQPEAASLNHWLADFCTGLKKIAPEMPILMAPAGLPTGEYLEAVYHSLPIDILAPRVGIGSSAAAREKSPENLEFWSQLSTGLGTELWITVEPYEWVESNGKNQAVPASFGRLKKQLENVGQFSEKTVGWDMPYFFSHHAGEAGTRLRKEYMDNIDLGFVD